MSAYSTFLEDQTSAARADAARMFKELATAIGAPIRDASRLAIARRVVDEIHEHAAAHTLLKCLHLVGEGPRPMHYFAGGPNTLFCRDCAAAIEPHLLPKQCYGCKELFGLMDCMMDANSILVTLWLCQTCARRQVDV